MSGAIEQVYAEIERAKAPWLAFQLPIPPSVNRFVSKLGNKTPGVRAWARQADMAFMASPTKLCRIKGRFEAEFLFGRNNRADFHNYEKALFDWLESREFIENDRFCEWRSSGWSDAMEKGRVLVRLRPWQEKSA